MINLKYIEVLEKKLRIVSAEYMKAIEEDKLSSCDSEFSIEKLKEIEKIMTIIKNSNNYMIGDIELLHIDLDNMLEDLNEYYLKEIEDDEE